MDGREDISERVHAGEGRSALIATHDRAFRDEVADGASGLWMGAWRSGFEAHRCNDPRTAVQLAYRTASPGRGRRSPVHVLSVPLDRLGEFTRAKRPQRMPTVLTQTEVATVLDRRTGVPALMASL